MRERMKAVIFDFNGTLFQDSQKHEQAWLTFARQRFSRELTSSEMGRYVHGRNASETVSYLAGKKLSRDLILAYGEEKEKLYRQLCLRDRQNLRLTEGAAALFDYLKERAVPRGIATAAGRSNLDFYIQQFQLLTWFSMEHILYDDGTIPGKPQPDFYIRAAKNLGVPVKDCLVFEDSESGILAAQRAGIGRVIGVSQDSRKKDFFKREYLVEVIFDFREFDRDSLY